MTRVLVDTNVLVSMLTDRNLHQQRLASQLFSSATEGECEVILHQSTLTELVYVLGNLYEQSAGEIAEILADLLAMPGVLAFDEVSWIEVLEIWPTEVRDFGNALLAASARLRKHDGVATFDLKFRRALGRLQIETYWNQASVEETGTHD